MYQTNCAGGEIKVNMPAEGIFHVKASVNSQYKETLLNKYGILKDTDMTEIYSVETKEKVTKVSDTKYTLKIDEESNVLILSGSKRQLSINITAKENGFLINIPITKTERLFGLGDETRECIMKRGRIATMWQQNVVTYGPIPFLLSADGWGILVNCTYKHTYDLGKTNPDEVVIEAKKGQLDFYIFLADSMKEIIGLYTDISGKPIMLPKYAYGLTFVCNEDENARDLLDNCLNFRREDIPCDIMGIEPNWMETHYDYSVNKKWNSKMFWLPYWQPETYNGIQSFFYNIRKMGYKFTLWLCNDYDLFWHEEKDFETEEKTELRTMSGGEILDVHFSGDSVLMDPVTIPSEPWFEHLKKFVDQGAAGFKLDGAMQVMPHPDRLWGGKYTDDEIHNLYPVVYVKQMQEGYTEHTGNRALIYTPCLYAGTQKYAATWAGDTGGGFKTIPYVMNMAFCGHSNASCDLALEDPMAIHFGFLMPWSQILSWRGWYQPWYLGDETENMIRDYAKLRSSLFPYIYSMSHYAAKTGIAIVRPLSLTYEDVPEYDEVLNMYMFGDSLLVGAFDMHLTLPEGKWTDWFTGKVYDGGRTLDYEIPEGKGGALFVKEGSVFVTQSPKAYLEKEEAVEYTVNVFSGKDCSFDWIEDDGISYNYMQGIFAKTCISVTNSTENGFTLTVAKREMPSELLDKISEITDLTVKIYGEKIPSAVMLGSKNLAISRDEQNHCISFVISKESRTDGAELNIKW